MIRTYGINHPAFKEATKEQIFAYFKEKTHIQFDSETTGFDCHLSELVCVQVGDVENQFVIHPDKLGEFKKMLEKRILIMHNAKFDVKFLYKQGIWPRRVYDTFLAEGVIHCGIPSERKNLAHIAEKRLGINIDKSVRDIIWKEGLTERVIRYAAGDVEHLEAIKDSQAEDLERLELTKALDIENQFVLCLAYIEYCGFKLDGDKWNKKHIGDVKLMQEKQEALDKYIFDHKIDKFINPQIDMFNEGLSTTLNWASPAQVTKLFKHLKIPVEVKKKGEVKETVEAKHIGKYRKKFDIIDPYLEYKEAEKVVGTYGPTFSAQINSVTNRLHTSYRQIMDTGRISSGGKDKATGEQRPNLQNIPRDKATRGCFIADKGNILVIGDFSSQESVLLTNLSMEPKLIDFFENGGGDMHAFVASKMYKELEGLTFDEIKELHPEKRYNAKTAGFSINYGGVGATIADNSEDGITVEEGDEIYDAYFEAFPGLKAYFNKAKKEGLDNGFILISHLTGRKSFIFGYQKYLEMKKKMDRKFWDRWKWLKLRGDDSEEYKQAKQDISSYFDIKGEIERKSLNFPIQGQAAEISKIAGILFFNWILDSELQNTVLIANAVHDEYVVECPKALKKDVMDNLKSCMLESGKEYCKRIPLKAEVKSGKDWADK